MIPPTHRASAFPSLEGFAARLCGVRRAMPALRERGTDPQPTGAFLRCRAGRLLPHSCEAFSQPSSKISAPGGALRVQQLETSSLVCCFSIFHNCEGETKAFPTQPGQAPVGAYTSILTRSQTLPRTSLPSARRQGTRSPRGCLWLNFKTVSSLSVGLTHLKAGPCSHRRGGNGLKKWIGPNARHCWQVPSMAQSDYKNLAALLVAVTPLTKFVVIQI